MLMVLADLLITLVGYLIWVLPFFHPARRGRRATGTWARLSVLAVGLFQCAFYFGVTSFFGNSLPVLNVLKIIGFYAFVWWPFVEYPGQVYQNLFLICCVGLLSTVVSNTGNYAELQAPVQALWSTRLQHAAIDAGAALLLMPVFLLALRRLIRVWQGSEAAPFWRMFWLIPGSFFLLTLVTSNVFLPETLMTAASFTARLFTVAALYVVMYVLSRILEQSARLAVYGERARMTEQQLTLQREQYAMLTRRVAQSRAIQRDLRQQMLSLRAHAQRGDAQAVYAYLHTTLGALPSDAEVFVCKNYAVNALVRYDLAIAEREGIRCDVQLDVPEQVGRIRDADLCIVFGNSLENAIEASRRISRGQRSLRVRARMQGDYLAITLDNAFDGAYREEDGAFFSRKRAGEGIGISSIRAIAARYSGEAAFSARDDTFYVSIVLRHTGEGDAPPQEEV